MQIKQKINNINVDIEIKDKVNVLRGFSGTGKTFLMDSIKVYCEINGITCRYIDYGERDLSESEMVSICKDRDMILLDNADLYLNNELLEKIKENSKYIIISMKDLTLIDMREVSEYRVHYNNREIKLEKF